MKFDPTFTPAAFEALSPEARCDVLDALPDGHPVILAGRLFGLSRSELRERLLTLAARNTGN